VKGAQNTLVRPMIRPTTLAVEQIPPGELVADGLPMEHGRTDELNVMQIGPTEELGSLSGGKF
jgi:hypothetical protein